MAPFLSALPNDRFLVNAPTGLAVDTGLFKVHGSGVIAVIDPSDLDEADDLSSKALRDALNLYLGSGNDGGLAWIPAPFAAAFAPFVAEWLPQALERGALNLDNGALSEAFVLYPVADGLVVGMIDPECGTAVFDDVLAAFVARHGVPQAPAESTAFDPAVLFNFEDCHLASNLLLGRSSTSVDRSVDRFLMALYERGLLDESFALNSEAPEAVIGWLEGRKVTVTGTFGVTREAMESWLGEVGAVVTGTPGADGLLLVGDKPGASKLARATKVGTEQVRAQDLVARLVAGHQAADDAGTSGTDDGEQGDEPEPSGSFTLAVESAAPVFNLHALTETIVLLDVREGADVETLVFRGKADSVIVAFDQSQMVFLNAMGGTLVAERIMLEDTIHGNPDGGVLWVPIAHAAAFRAFAVQALREAFANDELTFDNGGVSEGFFIHTLPDGLAVMLFDPECGTGFFEATLERFAMEHHVPLNRPLATTFNPNRLQWFEDSHLASNLVIGRRTVQDAAMLLGFYERGVLDERFALDLNVTLQGDLDVFFRTHPVTITGQMARSDDDVREWLVGTAHAQVVDVPVAGGVLLVGRDPDDAVLTASLAVVCPILRASSMVAGLVQGFLATPRSPRAQGLVMSPTPRGREDV